VPCSSKATTPSPGVLTNSGTAVEAQHVVVLAGTEQCAVLHVLRRHVDERKRMVCALAEAPEMSSAASSCPRMSKIGAAEQVSCMFWARKCSARWMTIGRCVVRHVPNAVRAQFLFAPHDAFAESAADAPWPQNRDRRRGSG